MKKGVKRRARRDSRPCRAQRCPDEEGSETVQIQVNLAGLRAQRCPDEEGSETCRADGAAAPSVLSDALMKKGVKLSAFSVCDVLMSAQRCPDEEGSETRPFLTLPPKKCSAMP